MKEKVTLKHSEADMHESKRKALEVTFSQIEKQYGKGSVMLLGDQPKSKISAISSGSLLIDEVIGVGGYPTGRIIEIFGPESSGKTTLSLHVVAQAQRNGGMCAFIDAEHALDPSYAAKVGVNVDELIVSQPDCGEQALEIVEMLVRSGAVDVVVVDSVAALVPRAELEGDMGDSHMGLQARLMSQALRKLTAIVHKSKTVLIFINQVRQTLNSGVMFGPKETTTGGKALKFYASVRLDVRRIATLKKDEFSVGNRVMVKAVKNKVAPPFKSTEVDLLFDVGISKELDLLDAALKYNIVTKNGAWLQHEGKNFAQGRDQAYQLFKDNKTFTDAILAKVKEAMSIV